MKKVLIAIYTFFSLTFLFCEDITFINSENIRYVNDSVYCNGNVIIIYSDRIIFADKIYYNKKDGFICANGNVIIKDEKQNVYFLDSLTVNSNFTSGNGENIKIIMADKSRLAAVKCIIKNGKYELENIVYTPCYECSNSGNLTWQIKSLHVVFDPEDCVEYEDVKFELFGTPIFYIPYLYHTSSKIEKKSGFLMPKISTSNNTGFSILPKYLYTISDSQELILKPIITQNIGSVGWMYYGLRFPNGEFNIDTSITNVESVKDKMWTNNSEKKAIEKIYDSGYRGHIFSKMRYEINDIWRCSTDINLASDRYYLKRFPFIENVNRILESNAKLEGFDNQNYTCIKAIAFQSDNYRYIPRILPIIERNYSTELLSGSLCLDLFFVNLDFNNHRSAQKLISNASWSKAILLPLGHVLDINGVLSLRAIKVSEKERTQYDSTFGTIPQINLVWKWPLVLSSDLMTTILTPVFGITIAKNGEKTDLFEEPFCEITDINFLEGNKSASSYDINPGNRICYGLKLAGYKKGEILCRFTIGRSVEFSEVPDRLEATGLKHKNSNIVTSMDAFLSDELTVVANGSYSVQSKRWSKIETGLNFLNKEYCFDVMVFRGEQCFYNPFFTDMYLVPEEQKMQKYKGIMLDVGFYTSKCMKLKSGITIGNDADSQRTNNNDHFRQVKFSVGIEYKNECTAINFSVERRNYKGGDLKPETVINFVVHLKNLDM